MKDISHSRDSGSRAFLRGLFFVPTVAFLLISAWGTSQAQQSGVDIQRLGQQLQGMQQGSGIGLLGSPYGGQLQGQQPDMTTQVYTQTGRELPLPPSRLEQIVSARAGVKLTQFGYDQLGRGRNVTIAQTGAVQDSYILGPGDQIIVSLRGQENSEFRAAVDRNGQVILPRLKPLAAAGRSFGDFRADMEAAVHRAYVATDAAVSVATVRQISVLVSGEVNNPGQRAISGLGSVVDALLLSGGVRKTGSLRNIRIQRGGREYPVDLYNVLTARGAGGLPQIADGDRILVPPLGRTVAVAGLVRQPGIFELLAGQSSISVRNLLALSGGQEVRGRYRLAVMRVQPDGQLAPEALSGENGVVRDSEILTVQLGADQVTSQATLAGGMGLAGQYAIQSGQKLSDLLRQPGALGLTPYTLFGVIIRRDPQTYLRYPIAFSPVAVLNGRQDIPLQSDDLVRIISVNESRLLNFIVRAYLGRLATDQANQRNPLVADLDARASASSTSATAAANIGPNATPSDNAAVRMAQDPDNPANLSKQAQMFNENQFGMDDVVSAPADVQRANITALLDLAQPGTTWARQKEQDYRDRMNPPVTAAGTPVPRASGQTQQIDTGASDAQDSTAGTMQTNMAGTAPNGAPTDMAANYMEQQAGMGGYASNREVHTFGELARQLGMDPLVLVNFLVDNRARIDGAVAGPGSYFVGPGTTLSDLVQAAGNTVNWADQSGVELMTTAVDPQTGRSQTVRQTLPLRQGTLASYVIRPHDQFRFNRVYSDAGLGSVSIQGDIRSAGNYPITRGEHLSDLLARAGGLTSTSYPEGTVYLRKSAAATERDGYLRTANEVQNQLLAGMARVGNDKIPPETFTAMQGFITQLRTQKAMGRVTFTADPSVLAAHPEQDPLLEAGDVIYIPQRPSTVSVLGEVMQPGTYAYRAGATIEDYVRRAGGYAQFADQGSTFVVMPDGSARQLDRSWLHFSVEKLPPGTSIVVPRDLTPIDTRQIILDVTGIMSSLAVSLASLAVISRN